MSIASPKLRHPSNRARPGRAGVATLAALLVAACASEPAYAPPTDDEARAAYVRAIRADWIESPPPQPPEGPTAVVPGDTPTEAGRKVGSVMEYESEMNTRAAAPGRIQRFDRIALGECGWAGIDADDIQAAGRGRVEGIGEGYRCAYEVFFDTPTRGRVSAEGAGYFFQREGSYDFGEIEQATFEEVEP